MRVLPSIAYPCLRLEKDCSHIKPQCIRLAIKNQPVQKLVGVVSAPTETVLLKMKSVSQSLPATKANRNNLIQTGFPTTHVRLDHSDWVPNYTCKT